MIRMGENTVLELAHHMERRIEQPIPYKSLLKGNPVKNDIHLFL